MSTTDGPISLKEYFEALLSERQTQADNRHQCLQYRFRELEHRIEDLNQLRKEVVEDRIRFVTIATYDSKHEDVVRRMNDLQDRVIAAEASTASTRRFITVMLGVTTILLGVIAIVANLLAGHL